MSENIIIEYKDVEKMEEMYIPDPKTEFDKIVMHKEVAFMKNKKKWVFGTVTGTIKLKSGRLLYAVTPIMVLKKSNGIVEKTEEKEDYIIGWNSYDMLLFLNNNPYASDAQRGWMHIHHPEIARRWDAEIHNKKHHKKKH